MKLWHNGQVLSHEGIIEYSGGEFEDVDYCDYDKMSIVELDSIIKDKLKYTIRAVYYLKVLGMVALQYVSTDEYLMKCLHNCFY